MSDWARSLEADEEQESWRERERIWRDKVEEWMIEARQQRAWLGPVVVEPDALPVTLYGMPIERAKLIWILGWKDHAEYVRTREGAGDGGDGAG